MMPQFQPDTVTFKDIPGMGMWDCNHHREHLQFVQVLAGQTPTVDFPAFDFLQMLTAGSSRKSIVETHQEVHQLLSQIVGATAVDFSQFDLDNDEDFYSFLSYHSQTHSQIRQFLGIV
jgi:hypothetical protein